MTVEHSIDTSDKQNFTASIKIEREHNSVAVSCESSHPLVFSHSSTVSRFEGWWIVIGNEKTKSLLAIKKVSFSHSLATQLTFTLDDESESKADLKLYLISDGYLGCDQEFELFFPNEI